MSDYFSNFNDWKNTTGAESVHSSGQDGDYASHIIGSNWTYQDGDVTWSQTGNMGYKQIGVSNSLIEGFSFFTVLGMNINDTVGIGMDNYAGLRVGIHGGLAVDVNAAAAVRLSYGPYYEIDKTWKTNLSLEEIATASKSELTIANEVKAVINQEIRIAATSAAQVANFITTKCQSRMMECTTLYSVTAPVMTLKAPTSFFATTNGQMSLSALYFDVQAVSSVTIAAKGIVKLG